MKRAAGSWVTMALLAAALFAGMGACVRMAAAHLPESEVVFFRNFFSLLMLLPLLIGSRVRLTTTRLPLHLFRASVGLAAMYLYFHALARLPLADALLLNYTSPLFVTLSAAVWLKEPSTKTRRWALLLGLAGILLVFHPSSQIASLAGLLGLASGALAGIALAAVKQLSDREPSIRIVVWFALLASLISAVPMAMQYVRPDAHQWLWLLATGAFGSLGQLGMTRAYALAPASKVSPLGYASLIFAGLIGYAIWGERPDALGLAGAVAIIGAGVLVVRERSEPLPNPPSAVPLIPEEGQRPPA
jgi:drug/metabolite transporter (DMT)-like permease